MATSFLPKQAIPFSGDLLDEVQCRVSVTVAGLALEQLPALDSTSIVHDNGCGTGAVTEAIVAKYPSGITIEATDIAPPFIATFEERIKRYGWPARVSVADCLDLKEFADGTFTHSLASFLFMGLPDHTKAAREIRRTLKDNGTAALVVWEDAPHIPAIIEASKVVRGDSPIPAPLAHAQYTGKDAIQTLIAAGFDQGKIKLVQKKVSMDVTDPVRWANLAWTFLGTPPTGWSKKDEEQWQAATTEIIIQMEKVKGARTEPCLSVPMLASIVVAQK